MRTRVGRRPTLAREWTVEAERVVLDRPGALPYRFNVRDPNLVFERALAG